jgi:hypothetical protein
MYVVALNPDGSLIGSSGGGSVTVTGGTITSTPFATTSTTSNSAPVTTPAAAAQLSQITLPAGAATYEITAMVNVGGTTGAVDISNVSVTVSGGATTRIANGIGAAGEVSWFVTVTGGQTVTANAVATATTGAVYGVTLIATRVA